MGYVYLQAWQFIQLIHKKRQRWQLPTQVYCDKMQRHNPTKLCTVLSESPACVMSFHNQTVQHARQLVECVNTN